MINGKLSIKMASIHISLSDQLKGFVRDEAAKEGFSNNSDYVRSLIREEWKKRQAEKQQGTKDILQAIYQITYQSTAESREQVYKKLAEKPRYQDQDDDELMQTVLHEIALSRNDS